MTSTLREPRIRRLEPAAYVIPTDRPEADGTLAWDSTTMLCVEAIADNGSRGLGYSYTAAAAATIVHDVLAPAVVGRDVSDVGGSWAAMVASVRNVGRPGVAACAVSAVDVALWDLKAKASREALFRHLGTYREAVPVYGSGGFTSYSIAELVDQLGGWVADGIDRVKMKVGLEWGAQQAADVHRVHAVRRAIGGDAELYVDANGAYGPKEAVRLAERFADDGVAYFEEPVSSDQLEQLAFVRAHAPMAIAAGEYGYDRWSYRRMLEARAVDILQADATRCLGVTGFLAAATLADSFGVDFSAHTAPAIHAQLGCAVPRIAHIEWFHDHVRIERMLFEGLPEPVAGAVSPDPGRPGLGLELRRDEGRRWAVAA